MSKKIAKSQEELLQEALVPIEEQPYEVPGNWAWVKLIEIVEKMELRDPIKLQGEVFHYVDVESIDNKNQRVREYKETLISEAPSRAKRGINQDDVIISLVRPYLKNIALIEENNQLAVASTAFYVCRTNGSFAPKFLYNYLRGPVATAYLNKHTKGDNSPSVRNSDFELIPIPLPPLNEQKRIADKVERLLYKLEQAKELVVQTMENIDLNRKSVIVNAYLGKLTEEWRRTNQINESAFDLVMEIQKRRQDDYLSNVELTIKATSSPRKNKSEPDFIPYISHEDSSLPKNWCMTRILDLTECLDRFRKPVSKSERENRPGDIPYYGANGQVDTINDYIFNDDIVLVVEDETFTGREKPFSYIVRGKSWVNNHAHVLRPLGGIDVEYLNICLSYYNFIPLTSGSTGRRKLTQAALNQAPLRLAPLSEQKIIVSKVRKVYEVLDKVKQNCIITLERIECIKESILNKAFKGELGTYDHAEVKAIDLLIENEVGLNYRGQ
ncbi:restriction endonuclease subunit S [Paenibacillus sp. FSL R10-2788]|uniref:restriction endonuclease subunit S n=1 Tax=Paenibacillus sp. FSL R10-2788 TaxID=2954694 RepID=UPI0030F8384D